MIVPLEGSEGTEVELRSFLFPKSRAGLLLDEIGQYLLLGLFESCLLM